MGGFLIAWLVGLGLSVTHEIYVYRVNQPTTPTNKNYSGANPLPIKPGRILLASGIFAGLAILAEVPSMHGFATLSAWGYNIAIGIRWAQEYHDIGPVSAKAVSPFWNPPTAPGDVLFPTGGGSAPATPASLSTTPGKPSGGPVVA